MSCHASASVRDTSEFCRAACLVGKALGCDTAGRSVNIYILTDSKVLTFSCVIEIVAHSQVIDEICHFYSIVLHKTMA